MSLSYRHRAGLMLAGAVIAAPLFAAGSANAGTTTITFSGQPLLGVSTLACPSTPSRSKITVAPNTVIDFVNRTGKSATLWAGDSQKNLPNDSLVPVTFTSGPASVVVQMLPDCSLDLGKHVSMTVTVSAPGAAPTTPPPATGPTGSGSGTGGGRNSTPSPRAAATTERSRPTPTAGATATATSVASTNSHAAAPPSAGSSDDSNPFAAAPTADAAKSAVIGPVSGPRQPRSASGLLTLIATVGVVGVAAAAIRAILAQRANRALTA